MSLFNFLIHTPLRMAQVRRYATLPVQREENILEHSYVVALISYLIAKDCGADSGKAVQKALFHDMEEAVTGDICRDFKYLDTDFRNSLRKVEPNVMFSIADRLPYASLFESVLKEWEDSKDESLEGLIVEAADSLAVFVYLYEEYRKGNKMLLEEVWDEAERIAIEKLNLLPATSVALKTLDDFRNWKKEQCVEC